MALVPLLQELWDKLDNLTLLIPFLFSLLFFFPILFLIEFARSRKLNLPPSPPKLPIIGNLHQVGTIPYRSLRALSEKYGAVMLMNFGRAPTVVISSVEMAHDMLKTHDIVFASRTRTMAAEVLMYGCSDVVFAPYGEYWRQTKKACVLELLSAKKVQSYQSIREEEVGRVIQRVRRLCGPPPSAASGDSVNLTELMRDVTNNILARCSIGFKCDEEDGKNRYAYLSTKMMAQITAVRVGELFPLLGWIDVLTGTTSRLNETSRELDSFLDGIIEQHRIDLKNNKKQQSDLDFIDILLRLQRDGLLEFDLTQERLKAILLDMALGGSVTTSSTMVWTMAELVKNPVIMNKAQEEVRKVVGNKTRIEESDTHQMGYLKCVIKEALRLHPPAPVLTPREPSASIKLGGYDIPQKTPVFINAWAIQRDSRFWDRAEEFIPERFETSPVDFKGQYFQFIPFGAGRRGCPGMSFANAVMEHVIANLLYWFDWQLPGDMTPQNFDMSEAPGLSGDRKFPLHLVPSLHST